MWQRVHENNLAGFAMSLVSSRNNAGGGLSCFQQKLIFLALCYVLTERENLAVDTPKFSGEFFSPFLKLKIQDSIKFE